MISIIPNSFILTNIPKVRSRGLEFEASAQITRQLHATAGYAAAPNRWPTIGLTT